MHYRVEIQREHGRKRRAPLVVYGQLNTYRRAFGARSMVFLQLSIPNEQQRFPALYEPVLIEARHEGMRFSGMELTEDGAWVSQTWWCTYSTVEEALASNRRAPLGH
jgi:hypothetical protein